MHVYAVKNVDFKDGALLLEFYALISEPWQQTAGLLQEQNAALKIPIQKFINDGSCVFHWQTSP